MDLFCRLDGNEGVGLDSKSINALIFNKNPNNTYTTYARTSSSAFCLAASCAARAARSRSSAAMRLDSICFTRASSYPVVE